MKFTICKCLLFGLACASFFVLAVVSAAAQDKSRVAAMLDTLPKAKKIDQVAISPDGSRVAWISEGKLTVSPVSGGDGRAIAVEPALPLREVTWSVDGSKLAFLADLAGDVPAAQLWNAPASGGAAEKLADLKGFAQTPRFSPDGSKLAVLFIEGMPRVAGPLQPMTPLSGVIGQKIYEQRLTTIALTNHAMKQVTPADVYIYEYDWTPDGTNWVATAAHGSGDANWWIARLYRIDTASGAMQEIYKPKWQIADPHVSPDGANVALVEGIMSDAGLTGGDIMVVPLKGGAARNITPGIKASPSGVAWASANRITFSENIDGNSGFASVSANGGAVQQLWSGEETTATVTDAWVPNGSFSRDGSTVAVVRQTGTTPPEVWAGPIGKWRQFTHLNEGVKPGWGEMKDVHWMNGATRVQGWLMLPKDYDAKKKYPLVINVHGGPSWACTSEWADESNLHRMGPESAMGYFALCPNPRGSYGQGEAFTQGNVKDFGGGDYQDIMASIDALAKEYPIDTKRVGLRGHSYGGYMAMWAETQTQRFAAIVAGAGLSNWQSYYGVNDIDEWMIPFFGASIYDDPAVYAKADPMHFVKNVKTPTLVLVGDRDGEVPMEQSVEWWHALEALKVPTTLVVYPNEGHLISKPDNARDYVQRSLEWFDQWFTKAVAQ